MSAPERPGGGEEDYQFHAPVEESGGLEVEASEVGEKYSESEVVQLILLSFRFSEGSADLQRYIFQYLAKNFKDKFAEDPISDEAKEKAWEMARHIVVNPQTHAEIVFPQEVEGKSEEEAEEIRAERAREEYDDRILEFYFMIRGGPDALGPVAPEEEIARQMLWKEVTFFVPQDYRTPRHHRPREQDRESGPLGAYTSFYAYYGLTGQKAPTVEFKQFFDDISMPEVLLALEEEARDNLSAILPIHYEHHPDEDFESIPSPKKDALSRILSEDSKQKLGLE